MLSTNFVVFFQPCFDHFQDAGFSCTPLPVHADGHALEELEVLDSERLRHRADTIEHACAGIQLDIAEANQQRELGELSRLDAQLLAWEKRQAAKDR